MEKNLAENGVSFAADDAPSYNIMGIIGKFQLNT